MRVLSFKIILCAVVMTFSLPAYAGPLEFFFPSLKSRADDPAYTLQAPFADKKDNAEKKETVRGALKLPENAMPLDKPHRMPPQIGKWLEMVVSECLTFSGLDLNQDLEKIRPHFDPNGFQQYKDFLQEAKIADTVQAGRYKMNSFVENTPLFINEGVVQGRYSWLFEVPVMLSYIDKDAKNYKKIEPINQYMTLTIQVARFPEAENDAQVSIQRWVAKSRKVNQ